MYIFSKSEIFDGMLQIKYQNSKIATKKYLKYIKSRITVHSKKSKYITVIYCISKNWSTAYLTYIGRMPHVQQVPLTFPENMTSPLFFSTIFSFYVLFCILLPMCCISLFFCLIAVSSNAIFGAGDIFCLLFACL